MTRRLCANRDLVGDRLGFFDNAPQKLILALIWPVAARHSSTTLFEPATLLQLRVLRFCLLADGNVRISILPEGEKRLVSDQRTDAGGVGVSAL